MSKMRVYQLANELDINSKELIEKMEELGMDVKSHMSTIEDDEAEILMELFAGKSEGEEFKDETKSVENNETPKNSNCIEIPESITVSELSKKIKIDSTKVIGKLIGMGVMAALNQSIDYETAEMLAKEFEVEIAPIMEDEVEDVSLDIEDDPKSLKSRAPIVTVMGHVDHGKTSLLDAMRETNVTDREAGGITQHIGASTIFWNNQKIVFLDTPGHEAFTSMRARGAQATDIAILVVAADDGVMPQTVEAINHAKAAGVPIIVAINKIDKVGANPDRVLQELTEHGLVPEAWGGDTITVEVSALTKKGIEDLLEMILLVAEMQELKANPNRSAMGIVIEARLDKQKGSVCSVLIKKGTLRVGDSIVVGRTSGKVRAMLNDKNKNIKKAGPSTPVEILGLNEVPDAGDFLYMVDGDKQAKNIAKCRVEKERQEKFKSQQTVSLDDLFNQIQKGTVKDLNLIIKADVKGSIEAVKQSLLKLSNDEIKVNPIHGGVGAITDSDIMLASASNAIIIGFNVRPTNSAMELGHKQKIDIRTYRIIYNAIEDIEAAIKGMLEPEYVEKVMGRAEVRAVFKVPNMGFVAGVYILNGKVTRNSKVRLLRDNIVIHEGEIGSLRRFKDDVKELASGYEGGLGLENYNDIKEGDVIEAYIMDEVKR
jgi:translation initiation factor IF-2